MVKLFFSHVCSVAAHQFLDWISERVKKDLQKFEPFIACKNRDWNDARELNAHLDESQFFIPAITDEYPDSLNCTAELSRSRTRKNSEGMFPVILPIKFGCNSDLMQRLGFKINQGTSEGERWIDFSDSKNWEPSYEEFIERVTTTALKQNLIGDEDFYKDCQHLDIIIKRSRPTAPEMKFAVDLCRKGKEYGNYFFGKLVQKEWIDYLKSFGFFKNNPPPIESPKQAGLYAVPQWPVLDYLEKVSKECNEPEDHQYAEALMQIIRDVTRPKDGEKADNYRTWWYFTKIMSNLPADVIKLDDIDLVNDWLDSKFRISLVDGELANVFMPKLLQSSVESDWKKATKLVEIVTRIRWVEIKYSEDHVVREPHAIIDPIYLQELFKKNHDLLGGRCGNEVTEILKTQLKEVLRPDKDDLYSYIWRPAIEDHEQNIGNDTRNVLISGLRDVLLAYPDTQTADAKSALHGLFNENILILKRIALYIINERYGTFADLFWEVITHELFDINLRHELFELLKRHFRDFSPTQQNQLVDIIDALTKDWREGADKTLLDAGLRLDWFQALKGQGNERVDRLYEEYLRIVKYPSEHPAFSSYIETWAGEISPCSVEELLSKSVSEIVQYVNSFKGSTKWKEPTEEGLAEVLKGAVKQKPEKFENDLSLFLETRLTYQHSILRAFEELWNDKKIFNWGKVLDFCFSIISPDQFWQQSDAPKEPGLQPTRTWITSVISGLIETGVKTDGWAFEETFLPKAEEIILWIIEKEKSTAKGQEGNALNEAMNTPKGHCLMALVNYSLRRARLADKRKEERSHFWRRIQPVFDRELNQCTGGNFEFSALAGTYLLNLNYLSKEWIAANINKIFPINYRSNWRCAMEGYAYVSTFDPNIYRLLKEHGHLKEALRTNFKAPHVRQKLIQSISVGYLQGLEGLEGTESLFALILQDWKWEDIFEIISFFWSYHHVQKLEDGIRGLILDFWRWCSAKIRGNEADNASILSDLNLLTAFLMGISEEQKTWLLQSAPYVDEKYHSSFFLEYLDRHTSQYPEAVAEVYLKMLERTTPTYNGENIQSIVGKLYQAGLKEKANTICNKYAQYERPDLLRDLYDQYNP